MCWTIKFHCKKSGQTAPVQITTRTINLWVRLQLCDVKGQPQISVSSAAQYSVSSVITVAQTTQIAARVWHGHTPGSSFPTCIPEACWPSSIEQVLSLLLRGNMKSKPSRACLSKRCSLHQSPTLSQLHTHASERNVGKGALSAQQNGARSAAACLPSSLPHLCFRAPRLWLPKGNVDILLLFYCWMML